MPLVEGGKSSPTLEQSGEGASNARTVSKRQEAIHPPIACSVQQDGRARAKPSAAGITGTAVRQQCRRVVAGADPPAKRAQSAAFR